MRSRWLKSSGPLTPASQRERAFLGLTSDLSDESVALRTLTLQMLSRLVPLGFKDRGLDQVLSASLRACERVEYSFDTADRLQAGVDAWYCRHLAGLPHSPPDPERLKAALQWLADDDQLIYAWLIGEQAARCGLDVRVKLENPRPLREHPLHDAYWLTHLVLLDTDYLARPLSHPDASTWGDELEQQVPWLLRERNLDLAGEVAFCLRFMGRDAGPLLNLLERAGPGIDAHQQATALLALSAE